MISELNFTSSITQQGKGHARLNLTPYTTLYNVFKFSTVPLVT